MRFGAAWNIVRRELRGSLRLLVFFVACLGVGVGAVVAVAGLSDGVERAIRAQARPLLAGDLAVRSQRALPADLDEIVAPHAPGFERTDLRMLVTMSSTAGPTEPPGQALMVTLKAVDGRYPFYGELALSSDQPLDALLADSGAVVAPQLLERMGLSLGDTLWMGGQPFTLRATVLAEPDAMPAAFSPGPRVFITGADLDRLGLAQLGSRVNHKAVYKVASAEHAAAATQALAGSLDPDGWVRVESFQDAQPSTRRGLDRTEAFLGLVALLSLLVGGIGIAQTIRAWLASRMDAIAIYRCLGLTPLQVSALFLGQTLALALAGSLVGVALGTGVVALTPGLIQDFVVLEDFQIWQPWAALRGVLLGVAVAGLFAALPLADVGRVPPVRVLRRNVEPLPRSKLGLGLGALALGAGIVGVAIFQAGDPLVGAGFAGASMASAAVLAGAAWLATRMAQSAARRTRRWWTRHGLAAMGRPGSGTTSGIVAVGLGVMVVLGLVLIQARLSGELMGAIPPSAPTNFLVDIQPDQWPGVQAALAKAGAQDLDAAPMVTARLASVDGVDVAELSEGADANDRWALTREQRLTWREDGLGEGSTLVEGALWTLPDVAEASVEERFAERVGLSLGSTLVMDVQGVPIELRVTSIRHIRWESMRINFFVMVEPGVLDQAPHSRVATARIPAGTEEDLRRTLATQFPNITFVSVREVMLRAAALLERLGMAVQGLGTFTAVAGVLILIGGVSATALRRRREVALLKTVGTTQGGVLGAMALEYALVGLVAACFGAVGANGLDWLVAQVVFELDWQPHLPANLVAIGLAVVLVVLSGLGTSLRALRVKPIAVLREG